MLSIIRSCHRSISTISQTVGHAILTIAHSGKIQYANLAIPAPPPTQAFPFAPPSTLLKTSRANASGVTANGIFSGCSSMMSLMG